MSSKNTRGKTHHNAGVPSHCSTGTPRLLKQEPPRTLPAWKQEIHESKIAARSYMTARLREEFKEGDRFQFIGEDEFWHRNTTVEDIPNFADRSGTFLRVFTKGRTWTVNVLWDDERLSQEEMNRDCAWVSIWLFYHHARKIA